MPVTRHRKAVLILVCLLAFAAPLVLVAQERTSVQVPSRDGPANRAAIAKIVENLLALTPLGLLTEEKNHRSILDLDEVSSAKRRGAETKH